MLSSKVYQEKMVALDVDKAHCVKFWSVIVLYIATVGVKKS